MDVRLRRGSFPGRRSLHDKDGRSDWGRILWLAHVQAKQRRHIVGLQHLTNRWTLFGHRQRTDLADQIILVHRAQPEQQLRLGIEPRADAQQRRRDVLAHRGVVRATAGELDFGWLREQAGALTANPLHHPFGKPALQQFDQRVDAARAIGADRFPLRLRHLADA